MTDAPESVPVPAGQAFDAALARGRAAMADPLPVLAKVDREKVAARMVAELRGTLTARFAYAVPATRMAGVHRQSVQALGGLERRLRRRRARVVVGDFLRRNWLVILGLLVVAGLVGLAIVYREAMDAYVARLLATLPAPPQAPPAVAPPAGPGAAAPTGTTP